MTIIRMHSIIHLYIQLEDEMPNTAKSRTSSPITKRAIRETPAETPRKKNYRLRQSKIDRAREILGTRTETETIEQALEMVAFQREMLDAVDAMYGSGVVNVFDDGDAGAEVRR